MTVEKAVELDSIDMSDPDLFRDGIPTELLGRLRRECPAMWTEAPENWPEESGTGFWNITRAADIAAANRDHETFSSFAGGIMIDTRGAGGLEQQRKSFITWDPPRHTGPRSVVASSFRPKLMRRLEGAVRSIVVDRLNSIVEQGHCDFVEDFTLRVTLDTICDLIGVKAEDRDQMFKWAQSVVVGDDPELVAVYGTAEDGRRNSYDYMEALLAERRAEPKEDFASYLATACVKGVELTDEDRIGVLRLLVEAGADTTISSIALGIQAFSEFPDQWQLLLADRSLIPQAIEEILRWASVVAHMRRTATKDVELAGAHISQGDAVVLWFASANRDADLIDDPDRFDITRKGCPHLAFGAGGRHHCPGSGLARLEMRIVLEELLDRVPDIRVDGSIDRMRSNMILGVKRLPVRFTPSTPRP